MDSNILRDWFEKGESQRILAALQEGAADTTPRSLYYVSAALLDLGDETRACEFIQRGVSQTEGASKADFLALLAFAKARRGDLNGYLLGAKEAVRVAQTPLTLYHLGLAHPEPEKSLETLTRALHVAEFAADRFAATRNAFALAVPLLRLGRYREALHWLSYSELRTRHLGLKLALLYTRAYVQILLGETEGLEAELRSALKTWGGVYRWLHEPLSTVLADLLQSEGRYEEAVAIYRDTLMEIPRSYWSRSVHGVVRGLLALGHAEEAYVLASTTPTVADNAPYQQASAQLVLGLALWPQRDALPHLEAAWTAFEGKIVPAATEAALHLLACYNMHGDHVRTQQLRTRLTDAVNALGQGGLRLLGGRALAVVSPLLQIQSEHQAFFLGQATFMRGGHVMGLRPRGFDILALLLAAPAGLTARALSEAVYGKEQLEALRVEVYRLRKTLGIKIASQPYRLETPIAADFKEVERLLQQGRVSEVVHLYRGGFLPTSEAPGVIEFRCALESQLIELVLAAHELEVVWTLSQLLTEELQLWEALLQLPEGDPRLTIVRGRVAHLRRELGV